MGSTERARTLRRAFALSSRPRPCTMLALRAHSTRCRSIARPPRAGWMPPVCSGSCFVTFAAARRACRGAAIRDAAASSPWSSASRASSRRPTTRPPASPCSRARTCDRSPSQTVDDLLRQVPGFSLFRRSSSVVDHPTTQGVSLRGIGPSGASRAAGAGRRRARRTIRSAAGCTGAASRCRRSSRSRSCAAAARARGATTPSAASSTSSRASPPAAPRLFGQLRQPRHATTSTCSSPTSQGPFRLSVEGNYFGTDGYLIVKSSRRGSIDVDAASEHTHLQRPPGAGAVARPLVLPRGNLLRRGSRQRHAAADQRHGGGSFAVGGRVRDRRRQRVDVQAFTATSRSSRARSPPRRANRNSETLALDQHVPSTSAGGALQWSRRFGSHLALAGGRLALDRRRDAREGLQCRGLRAPARCGRPAGRRRRLRAGRVDAVSPQWEIVGGVRRRLLDRLRRLPHRHAAAGRACRRARASRTTTGWARARGWPRSGTRLRPPTCAPPCTRASACPPSTSCTACSGCATTSPSRTRASIRSGPSAARRASSSGGARSRARVTGYWNDVKDLVANVTLTTPLPDCPPGTTVPPAPEPGSVAHPRARDGADATAHAASGASSPATSSPTPGS